MPSPDADVCYGSQCAITYPLRLRVLAVLQHHCYLYLWRISFALSCRASFPLYDDKGVDGSTSLRTPYAKKLPSRDVTSLSRSPFSSPAFVVSRRRTFSSREYRRVQRTGCGDSYTRPFTLAVLLSPIASPLSFPFSSTALVLVFLHPLDRPVVHPRRPCRSSLMPEEDSPDDVADTCGQAEATRSVIPAVAQWRLRAEITRRVRWPYDLGLDPDGQFEAARMTPFAVDVAGWM
ncbi:hypothetical protein R3P38DRAFT_1628552 [Favolaschia claudopus]|uniref:Uncharacterized protein n=1 Tax=Favolaschia claudopus TaxID=2862362 RepID=A0AAW0DJJ5_9AGAR